MPTVVDPELRTGFVRQRRFLLVVSLLLAASYTLDLRVGESATIQGVLLTVGRPAHVRPLLWLAWVWALLRYWQFQRPYGRRDLYATWVRETHIAALRHAMRRFQDDLDSGARPPSFPDAFPRVIDIRTFIPDEPVRHEWQRDEHFGDYMDDKDGSRVYRHVAAIVEYRGVAMPTDEDFTATLSAADMKLARRRGWIRTTFNTHMITELYAPYVLAALPVVALLAYWRGLL